MRICDTYGAGFFFIPGTDTCLRIGGYVRADYNWLPSPHGGVQGTALDPRLATTGFDAETTTNVRITLNVDARSNTEYGLLRSFGQFSVYRGPVSGSIASDVNITSGVGASQRQSNILLERAFIQFAGFTFGFSASFFNFYQGDLSFNRPFGATATSTTVLAYTAAFGSGFSATVSFEDGSYRRWGNGDNFVYNGTTAPGASGPTRPLSGTYGLTYGANQVPDIVANLRVDQAWGSVQIMGALHQLRDFGYNAPTVTTNGVSSYGTPSVRAGDKWGWAVGAGLRLNLDALARGDQLWLQAVYADGALDYAFTVANQGGDRQTISGAANRSSPNSLTAQIRDGAVVAGAIQTTKAWSVTAGFRHFWTPALRSAIFGGYSSIDQPGSSLLPDVKYWQVGVNTIWSPVRNLDLGVEVVYHNINAKNQDGTALGLGPTAAGTNNTPGRTSEDVWQATIRVQRNF